MILITYLLCVLPFTKLFFTLMGLNTLIKKGALLRPLALILCVAISCIWILVGYYLFDFLIIIPIFVMVSGVLFLLIGCYHILFVNKEKIIEMDLEEKLLEKEYEEEMKKDESYEWIVEESRKILDSRGTDDYTKYSRLIDVVLDNDRQYEELKQLSKQLKNLHSELDQEAMKKAHQHL